MRYQLSRRGTAHSVGHLAIAPENDLDLEDAARLLTRSPMDEYLGKYLLEAVLRLSSDEFRSLCDRWEAPALQSVLCTAARLSPDLAESRKRFADPAALARESSMLFLLSCLQPDQEAQAAFCRALGENILDHRPLPDPNDIILPETAPGREYKRVDIHALARDMGPFPAASRPPCQETIARATQALVRAGVAADREARHEASLSPIGLMRPWQCQWRVQNGRLDHTVTGVQVAFGRGMDVEPARASYLMEMVERYSALPTVKDRRVVGLAEPGELVVARHSELSNALDPNTLNLEVPYQDQAVHWLEGRDARGEAVLVPAQAIFPFINLDEPSLFSGLNTTGLGAGNTLEEARLSGLLEAVERDAEALGFFDPQRSFRPASSDRHIRRYLRGLASAGIDVLIQDLGHESGIPCYKAYVTAPDGSIAKGAAASLSGARAVLSAITEIPYSLRGAPTLPGPADLPEIHIEDLPDFSTSSAAGDLALAQAAVGVMGVEPLWVDLTRTVMDIPVVRVLAPGFELVADFDRFSRLTARMRTRYEEAVKGPGDQEMTR